MKKIIAVSLVLLAMSITGCSSLSLKPQAGIWYHCSIVGEDGKTYWGRSMSESDAKFIALKESKNFRRDGNMYSINCDAYLYK